MSGKHKRKKRHIGLYILLILIIIIFLAGYALTYGGNNPIPKSGGNTDIIGKVKTAEFKGKPIELNAADLNNMMDLFVEKGISRNGITIRGAYTEIKDGKINLYVPFKYKGINLLLSTREDIILKGGRIVITPEYFKIGLINLPKGIVMKNIKAYSSKAYTVTETDISVSKKIIPFEMTNITVKDEKLMISIKKFSFLQTLLDGVPAFFNKR